MKNKRTFPLLMLIWVSFLFSANAFSQPDLIVKMVAVKDKKQIEDVHIGSRSFQLVAKVTNKGTVTSERTKVVYYRSPNEKVLPTDRELGNLTVDRLRPKQSKTYPLDTTAPRSIGEYYYGVYVLPVKGERKTGNNWFRPVSIWVYGGPGLDPPPKDFISDVAFTQNATYFVLNAQFLKLMSERSVGGPIYGVCGITLQIPGVRPGAPVPPGDTTDSRLDSPGYFMYPLQSLNDRKQALEHEESKIQSVEIRSEILGIVTTGVGALIGGAIGSVVPGAGTTAGVVLGAKIIGGVAGYAVGMVWKAESLEDLKDERVNEILRATANPTLTLHPHKWSHSAPTDSTQFLFLIPNRRIRLLPITIKQAFRLADGKERLIATRIVDWNLRETAPAAPHAQPMSLADYPPFQQLAPEIQEHLLQHFGETTNAEPLNPRAWQIPKATSLLSNYPNPFNPETWIPYQLAEPADVTLTIYDINGRVVRDLDLGHQPAGIYQNRGRAAYWDGKNAQGEPVASGIYFYTLKAGDFSATRKMLIRK